MRKNRVAVIGCGMIANKAHIPAYMNFPSDFELVAICDLREETARYTAQANGIAHYYTDSREMMATEKPDIVSVCSPNFCHKDDTLLALSFGANVICEKPVAICHSDAVELYDFARSNGKLLMACQTLRFLPERLAVKRLIDDGSFGRIYYSEISRIRRRGIPTWGKFHIAKYSGGGAFLDIGVHILDSALWLMGNPKAVAVSAVTDKVHTTELGTLKASGALDGVTANARRFNPDEMDVESFSSGHIRFENNASMNFKVAWASNLAEENNIKLSGTRLGTDTEKKLLYEGTDDISELVTEPDIYGEHSFSGHFHIMKNFAAVLKGGEELFVKPEETINLSAIIEAVYLSAARGEEVQMKEIYGD